MVNETEFNMGHRSTCNDTDALEFEMIVRDNIGWMLSIAGRILGDSASAEDAVQKAFTKVHIKLADFKGRSSVKTWIHRILVNESFMIIRKRGQLKETSIDGLLPQFDTNGCRIETSSVTLDTPETILSRKETRTLVDQKIASLPTTYRSVLVLRDIEGLSTAEVADCLDITETNVKVRLHRARAALKSLLDPFFQSGIL